MERRVPLGEPGRGSQVQRPLSRLQQRAVDAFLDQGVAEQQVLAFGSHQIVRDQPVRAIRRVIDQMPQDLQ